MTSLVDDSGNYLDYDGKDLTITKQVANFHDFKLKGNYSINFKLPNTRNNRKYLGYYGAQQITSPAFTQIPYNIVQNGNRILRGYLVIKGGDANTIEAFFISGNSNWFDLVQFNLKEILFQDKYVVLWNAVDTQKAATEGVIFPIVDWCYGGQRAASTFVAKNYHGTDYPTEAIQEVFPCVYAKTVLQELCNQGKIKVTGNLLSDPIFDRMLITPDGPDMVISDNLVKRTTCTVTASSTSSVTFAGDIILDKGDLAAYNTTTYRYTCPVKGTYRVTVSMKIPSGTMAPTFRLERGGVLTDSVYTVFTTTPTSVNFEGQLSALAGDTIYLANPGGATILTTTVATYQLEKTSKPYYPFLSAINTYLGNPAYVLPAAICPDMTGVDFIKFLCFYFGAYCTFDEESNLLTIDKTSKLNRADATDWSEYYRSHSTNYQTGMAQNNFIRFEDIPEVESYNLENNAGYGGYNLTTSFDAVKYKDLYKIPFGGSYDIPSRTKLGWFMPVINFYELSDDTSKTWSFDNVYTNAGEARFHSTALDQPFSDGDLVHIYGTSYTGYAIIKSTGTQDFTVDGLAYETDESGIVTKVTWNSVNSVNRLLLAHPGSTISDAGGPSTFKFKYATALGSSVSSSTACLAWFDKPKMQMNIDVQRDSLALDTIHNRTYNNTISELYWGVVKNVFNNPIIPARMLLPTAAFQSFDFTSLIYLKTEKLTGYFFANNIAWLNSETECIVELLYVD